MPDELALSHAKAHFSQVVRTVRKTGTPVTVTVDGQPAVRISPVPEAPQKLERQALATYRALWQALTHQPRAAGVFDAVQLVAMGRR